MNLTEEQKRQVLISKAIDQLFESIIQGCKPDWYTEKLEHALVFKEAVERGEINLEQLKKQMKERVGSNYYAMYDGTVSTLGARASESTGGSIDDIIDTCFAELEELPLNLGADSKLIRDISVSRLEKGQ